MALQRNNVWLQIKFCAPVCGTFRNFLLHVAAGCSESVFLAVQKYILDSFVHYLYHVLD